ncbi:MAG: hypothetical protein ACM3PT_10990 [Deltaproteobacteria bacterium]
MKKNCIIITLFFFIVAGIISCKNEPAKLENYVLKETCLDCHNNVKGLSGGHDPAKIGCTSCHLGNGKEKDKDKSHKGMILIPGNLSNAHLTCSSSNCHFNELARIRNSLMTTNSGIISIDRYVFGETDNIDKHFRMTDLGNSAADQHIRDLCDNCHLGKEKTSYAAINDLSRGGGCLACHLNYKKHSPDINDNFHPSVDLEIGNDRCFGCHSRSSRISTSYEGWAESDLTNKEQLAKPGKYRNLSDGRLFIYTGEDIHNRAGLLCIDCHSSQEVMGDSNIYNHSSEAVKIACTDCHPEGKFNTINFMDIDIISNLDIAARKYTLQSEEYIVTKNQNIPLVNTYFDKNNNAFLISKNSRKMHRLNKTPKKCSEDRVHKNLSCNMCHSAWAPRCIGCHTEYQPKADIKGTGKWIEHIDDFSAYSPAMGMKITKNSYTITPAIPGMIMTLDKNSFKKPKSKEKKQFFRYFSPVSPHTTSNKSRTCESCHLDPYSLGYGSGTLNLVKSGQTSKWSFVPDYIQSEYDGLPQDSWIGFLKDHKKNKRYSVRDNFKPLNLKTQEKVLQAGKCIYCHKSDSGFLNRMIKGNYKSMIYNRSEKCNL